MYFQLSPDCEHEDELKSFPEQQKFFVGTEFVNGKTFIIVINIIVMRRLSKSRKKNKSVKVFKNFETNQEGVEPELEITQFASKGNKTCKFLLTFTFI